MINIKELIEDPSVLSTDTLTELKALVEKYPFFQVARLLYVSNLYKIHSKEFGPELRKTSIFVPNRSVLFALTEQAHYELSMQNSCVDIETENDADRTTSLIRNFLENSTIETSEDEEEKRSVPSVADLTTDYASFLMQQERTIPTVEPINDASSDKTPQLKGAELIDSFIKGTQGKQRLDINEMDGEAFVSPELSAEDEEIYTESMVNIYIKQGRYQQALEILNKICLSNPKKSSNFAAQIQLLEIILKEKK